MTDKAKTYVDNMSMALKNSVLFCTGSIYGGLNGHKRFCRETGYALNDFEDERDRKEIPQVLYGRYVAACNLKPLLDMKEFRSIMDKQVKNK